MTFLSQIPAYEEEKTPIITKTSLVITNHQKVEHESKLYSIESYLLLSFIVVCSRKLNQRFQNCSLDGNYWISPCFSLK